MHVRLPSNLRLLKSVCCGGNGGDDDDDVVDIVDVVDDVDWWFALRSSFISLIHAFFDKRR